MSICNLCKRERELVSSHLIPAAAYKLIRADELTNPNPVLVFDGMAMTSSDQVQMPFLCEECEHRFNENGERYVLSQCLRQTGFALRDGLLATGPLLSNGEVAVYDLRSIIGDHVEELLYFGASIFWRASAGRWRKGQRRIKLTTLGPAYEEAIRKYLLDETAFPRDICNMVLQIPTEDAPLKAVAFPTLDKTHGYFKHRFYIPGLTFTAFVGKSQPASAMKLSLNQGRVFVGPMTVDSLFKGLRP